MHMVDAKMSFLRYFEGATPKRKAPKDTAETKDSKKKCEMHRSRKFQSSWTVNRPWLSHDENEGILTCKVCQHFAPSDDNAFVKGTKYLWIDGIKAHETSECRLRSVSRETAEKKPVHQSKAGKALLALKKSDHDKLIIKMRNAHACAKHSLSFKTYEVMCRLDKIKQLPVGSQYCTDKAGALFCESIAKTTRSGVAGKIENCSWCSISCDGSTDFTGEDMEAVYVRTCTRGKIEDSFLHLGSSESSCSEDIFQFLMETLKNMKLEETVKGKLVGFCADGASNMQGLQRAFEALGEKQLLPTRIGGTRWLPHYTRAINIFLRIYKVLRYQLENSSQNNAKAEGLARILCDGHVIVYIIAMKRVISNLQNLSLYLQHDNLSLADAYTRVESTKTTLTWLLEKEDSSVSAILDTESFSGEKVVFKGRKASSNLMHATIREILSSLDTRFPSSELISATLVSSFKNWPHLKEDQLKGSTYGEREVTVLYNHFSQIVFSDVLVSLEDVTDEWSTLRTLVYKKYPEMKESLTWEQVICDLSDHNLENIFRLVEVVLALPPTSVKCETAFSAMKLLKTKRRGRLGNSRLNDLMAIKIMSPGIEEFDPEPAIANWMMSTPSGQRRRVGERTAKEIRTSTVTISDSEEEEVEEATSASPNTSAIEIQATLKSLHIPDIYDDDSDCDEDVEMSEDLVFSLLNEYYRE